MRKRGRLLEAMKRPKRTPPPLPLPLPVPPQSPQPRPPRPPQPQPPPPSSLVGVDENDRISRLPDAVIHHIMSFLPTEDVVRTCILSKRWKFIWYSVPTLSFVFSDFNSGDVDKFYNYLHKYLKNRKRGVYFFADSVMTSFKLDVIDHYQSSKVDLVDKWLGFAVENKVNEISLAVIGMCDDGSYDFYCVPKMLDNARYLTVLELNGVKLDTSHSYSFPCLKTLTLKDVSYSDNSVKDSKDVVVKFLLGCLSIEKLRLIDHRFGFLRVRLESLSLKFMELVYESFEDDLTHIHVDAINLESLVLCGVSFDQIIVSSCKKIRNLSLTKFYGSIHQPSSFEALISNFPLIENLTLSYCNTLKSEDFKISSQHLKCFHFENFDYLYDGGEMKVVTIESAPKLAYICYEGDLNFRISMKSSSPLNGKIIIRETQIDYDAEWFVNMLIFLVNLSCSWNTVTLHVSTYKALICPENLKSLCSLIWPENLKNLCSRDPLLKWKHLRVITNELGKESDLKDALMVIAPCLETLSINKKVIF
ncbi:putative FBD-associated F-box protein At5g22720 [Cannabis sativa]|uniref:putative FBD-associated F-box protein At5g22720 n=1 Tax=Cannabis sativa TaxID=3483 RepID=UPI0029CA8201|nr:putative FBD-associated F-box protein At5g22720 [Cannabis sativa]